MFSHKNRLSSLSQIESTDSISAVLLDIVCKSTFRKLKGTDVSTVENNLNRKVEGALEIEAETKGAEETENDSNVGAMCQITYHHFRSRIEVILAETQNIAIRCGGDP